MWQDFILGGEAYREHVGAHAYPAPDDLCIYCQQPLTADALHLLQRYREFANDAARKRIDEANQSTDVIARELLAIQCPALAASVVREQGESSTDAALAAASQFVTALASLQDTVRKRERITIAPLIETAIAVDCDSANRLDAVVQLISDLETQSQDRKLALQNAQTEHDALKDRLELKQRIEHVLSYIDDAKWAERARQLVKKFPALLRSLTEVSKVASEHLLNTDFERRFREECAVLRAPSVDLDFPGRQSQAARRKMTASHKPSAVLSEGEQKVIALADFLAESALRLTPAPLVFDDPVNSLDYRRIHDVANRIAALADDRQVIVFTHNIWFATEMLSRFEKRKDRCSYFGVS